MKTNINTKLIFLTMVLVVFVFASCTTAGSAAGGSSSPQKEIIITDLADFEGKYAIVTFSIDAEKKIVAYSMPALVRNGTVSLDMLTPKNKPYAKDGDYLIILMITNSTSDEDLENPGWSGFILGKRIEGRETTISYTKFLDTEIFSNL